MGCSNSSQTSAVDTTRPSAKPEESNGASTTGAASENGKVAEDSETIPDQTPAGDSDAKPEEAPVSTSPSPPAGEEGEASAASPQPPADPPAEAPAEAPVAEGSSEAPAEAPEQATDSEPKAEEAPAPSE